MSGLQWNLLNTNAPAQISSAITDGFMQGAGNMQKLQMNQLAMEKARQDMEYNPAKLYSQMAERESRIKKNEASTEKTNVEIGKKELELAQQFALKGANAPPGQVLATVFADVDAYAATTGKTPEEVLTKKQEYQQIHDALGEDGLRKFMFDGSQTIKNKIDLMLGQGRLEQGERRIEMQGQLGQERNDIARTNATTAQGNLAVAEQNADTNRQRAEQALMIKEVGANRPHVANLMANGWMPTGRMTKPMLDSIEAAAAEAERQGLPFDPDAIRAYEFQGQKNTALGRTAGSRLVTARSQNIDTAKLLLTRMQDTAKELDFSNFKMAAVADKWIKGQTQDPVLTRYMTQRADALFALGNALKQNGITDKAIEIEEEAANPTVSPRAFDAWYRVQMEALNDAGNEMQKAYSPAMPNQGGVVEEPRPLAPMQPPVVPKTIGRFQIEVE